MALRRRKNTVRGGDARGVPERRGRGASAQLTGPRRRLRALLLAHLHALVYSLGHISRTPMSSLMTIAVIGIALALPSGLHLVLKNIQDVSAGWDNASQISLFLKKDLSAQSLATLQRRLTAMPEIARLVEITPRQALQEFRQLSDFGDALKALHENPFPTLLVVEPALQDGAPAAVEALLQRLQDLPEVEFAQLDMEWLKRWYALMEIGKRAVLVFAVLLALAVLLVIGNTIRLAVQNRRDEIEIQKLIGATDAFIRRPFLYSGVWHGLIGALGALLLVNVALLLIDGPVRRLSLLYDSDFSLQSLSFIAALVLLCIGALLGYAGARLAVGRHLREIEPT